MTVADWQSCPGIVDLAGADIEKHMGMGYRNFRLILNLADRAARLEDQQASFLFEADPGRPIPLLGEEALKVVQPAPLALDQAGE
ncbi:hypothetical protein HPT29_022850 [Microvirga terrae]|uniref:Uncharacterized protein n=1 Tax=Microvirga terrae TaxID=2740529 RepID=A0ABY5RPS2_9HYPH|nr:MULTISPECIES: hypothetical protein [Microvirga]MBQ0822252.1 hypothetical protein [Microvirga sp. HBU67558]UVF19241.1 hypothetical protein HPT29_022850 [Microvirga terrae]